MTESLSYAVFLHPQAIDTLGAVIKPYLTESAAMGPHIVCSEVDPSGAFFLLTVKGTDKDGKETEAELMLPNAFVKLTVSLHSEQPFGFVARGNPPPA